MTVHHVQVEHLTDCLRNRKRHHVFHIFTDRVYNIPVFSDAQKWPKRSSHSLAKAEQM